MNAVGEVPSLLGASPEHPLSLVTGLALIDYDNFRRRDEKTQADLEDRTYTLVDAVSHAFVTLFPDTLELDVRLYGGWTDPYGSPSRDASWLIELLPSLRRRWYGLIVRPSLATAMIAYPEFILRGTVRGSRSRQRQKMIDGMIGCDAIHMTQEEQTYVSIVSTDDDLLPAALSAYRNSAGMLVWMRDRPVGSAYNDTELLKLGLTIHQLEA